LKNFITKLYDNFRDEHAQTMTEYSVVLALIVFVTAATYTALGNDVEGLITAVRGVLP
jgi:Flp pilus assembly pilin Flp